MNYRQRQPITLRNAWESIKQAPSREKQRMGLYLFAGASAVAGALSFLSAGNDLLSQPGECVRAEEVSKAWQSDANARLAENWDDPSQLVSNVRQVRFEETDEPLPVCPANVDDFNTSAEDWGVMSAGLILATAAGSTMKRMEKGPSFTPRADAYMAAAAEPRDGTVLRGNSLPDGTYVVTSASLPFDGKGL